MKHYQHPTALVESDAIGDGSRIWAFAHVLAGARVGADTNICDHVFIEGGVEVGDRVTIKSGVQLWDGITVEDDVFIGPNATFSNDPFPRSKEYPESYERTIIRHNASIGAGAVLLPGVDIGAFAMVGAGAVVTSDVPAHSIVVGSPAQITGYVSARTTGAVYPLAADPTESALEDLQVDGCQLIRFPKRSDVRGDLWFAEFDTTLPFVPRRVFGVYGVPSRKVRGEHAHRELHQLMVCVAGNCSIVVDNGRERVEVLLSDPTLAVYVPPMIWSVQYKYSPDAVMLVLASEPYDPDDYIRDYEEYLGLVAQAGS